MGLSLEAMCAFLWLSFQMRLICNQYVNERLNSGRDVEENVLFVTSSSAHKKKNSSVTIYFLMSILLHHQHILRFD